MVANTAPIFMDTPNISGCTLTAANTAKDGTGTVGTAFTAGADGAYIRGIYCKALGTNVATVARFFFNNGSTNATATNNFPIGEISLIATTNTETAALAQNTYFPIDQAMPAGWTILVTLGTAVSAGWAFTAVGGDY